MSVMVEISAAVAGMAIGFGAARLVLGSVLAYAFKRSDDDLRTLRPPA